MKSNLDPLEQTMATVDQWLTAAHRPERCTWQTAMKIQTLTLEEGTDHLGAYLATIPPPKGTPWGWLIGCLRTSYTQFVADEKQRAKFRAQALAEAEKARTAAEATRCAACGDCGIANWGGDVECLADARHAVEYGGEICECPMGQMWEMML